MNMVAANESANPIVITLTITFGNQPPRIDLALPKDFL